LKTFANTKGGKMSFWASLQMRVMGDYCNIACDYCHYGKTTDVTRMSSEVLEAATTKAISHNNGAGVFCWHGGEPTLAGLDFFRQAVEIQDRVATSDVVNHIQTNGTMITPEFARFFNENRFGVGVSLDGPEWFHDQTRVDKGGRGTYKNVVRGINTLRQVGHTPSVIATVSKRSLPHAREIFHHLVRDLGFKTIHFSVVFDSKPDGSLAINNEQWYGFLRQIFREWCEYADPNVEIRELTEVIAWLKGSADPTCTSLGTCAHWFTVNHNGDIFPCEVVGKRVRYGNILQHDFDHVISTDCHRQFSQVVTFRPEKCMRCEFQSVCNNGCTEMRLADGERTPLGLYAYCQQRLELFQEVKAAFRT
jgi:uncharacterized protein